MKYRIWADCQKLLYQLLTSINFPETLNSNPKIIEVDPSSQISPKSVKPAKKKKFNLFKSLIFLYQMGVTNQYY